MSHRDPEAPAQSPSPAPPSAPPGAWYEPATAPGSDGPAVARSAGRGLAVGVAALVTGALRLLCTRRG